MSWDPYEADRRLGKAYDAETADLTDKRCDLVLFDENLAELGFIGDYLDLNFAVGLDGTGSLSSTAPFSTPLKPELCNRDPDRPLFIVAQTRAYRFSGVVTESGPRKAKGEAKIIDIAAQPLLERLKFHSLWKSPTEALLDQPKVAPITTGHAVTVVKNLAAANIQRAQEDPSWPIHVVPNYLKEDDTPWVAIESTMQSMLPAFLEALEGTGVSLQMWIWLPGDPPVPGMEDASRPTMVLDVVDKGTASTWTRDTDDGIRQYYRVLSGGGFVPEWLPKATPYESPRYEEGFQGTDRDDPWVSIDLDGPGVEEWSMPTRYATAPTAIWTGLRTGWLGAVMKEISSEQVSEATEGLIQSLADNINDYASKIRTISAGPPTMAGEVIRYEAITDYARQAKMGVSAFGEVMVTGTNGEDIATGLYESRGYRYLKVSIIDGRPFVFGHHLGLGDGHRYTSDDGDQFYDSITRAAYSDSPTVRGSWAFTVGSGETDDPPVIQLLRRTKRMVDLLQRYYTDTRAVATGD